MPAGLALEQDVEQPVGVVQPVTVREAVLYIVRNAAEPISKDEIWSFYDAHGWDLDRRKVGTSIYNLTETKVIVATGDNPIRYIDAERADAATADADAVPYEDIWREPTTQGTNGHVETKEPLNGVEVVAVVDEGEPVLTAEEVVHVLSDVAMSLNGIVENFGSLITQAAALKLKEHEETIAQLYIRIKAQEQELDEKDTAYAELDDKLREANKRLARIREAAEDNNMIEL